MVPRRCAVLVPLLASAFLAAAEPGSAALDSLVAAFPDNADLRSSLFSSLIGAPREAAVAYGERIQKSAAGSVLVRAVRRPDDFVVEFRNVPESGPLPTTRGTCLVQRSNAKGNYLIQAKIFLQDDPSCFLRLYPNPKNGSTFVDVVAYGALLRQGIAVQGMLYQLLVKPFPQLVEALGRSFDWESLFPRAGSPRGTADPSLAEGLCRALAAASDPEDLIAELPGAREFPGLAAQPAGFSADRSEIGAKVAYAAFPPYVPGKGLASAALRAAIYLDSLADPGCAYALFGEGFRALAIPAFDESGRFGLTLLSAGCAESDWEALFAGRKGGSVRIVLLPAAR